jgi:hypothetical protein
MRALTLLLVSALLGGSLYGAPLPRDAVPDVLKTWVPWVLHGHEAVSCPPAHDDATVRQCAWPSELDLDLKSGGGTFRLRAEAFAKSTWVALPGDAERWPQDVRSAGSPLAVIERDGHPHVELPPGDHLISGSFTWQEPPQSLSVPLATGIVRAAFEGKPVSAQPDSQGRLWLRRSEAQAAPDTLSLRVFRQVDDNVPMIVTTRYEISVAGRPRELVLPAALLPGFLPLALDSQLPARLADDGRLRVQLRPGNWFLTVTGRRMNAVSVLALPGEAPVAEEVWSFRGHNDVRLVSLEGVTAVDPRQTGMPEPWKQSPAYRLRPGDTMTIKETRRGDPQPAPDNLRLTRRIWLDFDGGGYTLQDTIAGKVSRSWRLDVAPPVVLGRVAIDGTDQFVTRLTDSGPYGVEVRHGEANISADSRIPGGIGTLPATAWQADFSSVAATLHLPPGWRLLHASGVDRADGSWLASWNLWDFFFVLVSAFAASRLFGLRAGVLFGAALVLTWHLPGAPQLLWPVLLAFIGLERVLPQGKFLTVARWGKRLVLAALILVLLPFAVTQVRQAIYPSLEQPTAGFAPYAEAPAPAPVPAAAVESEALQLEDKAAGHVDRSRTGITASRDVSVAKSAPSAGYGARPTYEGVDPAARIQTGPGLPRWQWRDHALVWQGPVERSQQLRLWLIPPWATAALTFVALFLVASALWVAAGRPRRVAVPRAAATLTFLMIVLPPPEAGAAAPASVETPRPTAPLLLPAHVILDELRDKLTSAPDCMPACAAVSRLHLAADSERIRLRLEVHAQEQVMVPLPGQAAQFRPERVLVGNGAAVMRRDDGGALWVRVPKGITQIAMESAAGDAASVQIALPMPPRQVTVEVSGWTLGGLDARGIATGALTLARERPVDATSEEGTRDDALPPFVRIERTLSLADRWTVQTTVTRVGPSKAPAMARIPLIAGEAVNDPSVRVEDGYAVVALGQSQGVSFASTLKEGPRLRLVAGRDANQIERWRLDADTRWHVALSGIAPVHYQEGARWLPLWQPWPGEVAEVAVMRPKGVDGQTITLDAVVLALTPGRRATDAGASLSLRSSQGGNHAVELPEGAQLLSVAIDGRPQPIRAEGRVVTLPMEPGAHAIEIGWREPRAMETHYRTSSFGSKVAGANATLQVAVPADRWVIAVGGPLLGPAVLFWGVVLVIGVLAWGLARTHLTPLGAIAWFLLGVGLAQASLIAAAVVVGWFLALAARRRVGPALARRRFNAAQVVLGLWTLAALLALLEAVHSGLLGYPDMLILGNGSSAWRLIWYQDRLADDLPTAWVVSVPLYVYRVLMLGWALWMARAVLNWARWAWASYSEGGYWRARPPGEKGFFSRSARKDHAVQTGEKHDTEPTARQDG